MATLMAHVLNSLERTQLRNAEATIKKHAGAFVEVGTALAEIRDKKLYRESHSTFNAYLKEKWDFEKSYASRLIAAAGVVETVANWQQTQPSLPDDLPKPTTESQVRPLTELPAEEQPAAWQEAVERAEEAGKPVTAAIVQEVVDERKPPVKEAKAGDQKKDPRLWKQIEEHLGASLRQIDSLHKSYSHGAFHQMLIKQIKTAMHTLAEWKKAVQ